MAAGQIRDDEEQVADLLAFLGRCGRGVQLSELFVDLVEHADDVGPVVAEVGRALLHLLGGGQRGHGPGDTVEGASNLGRLGGLIGGLLALGPLDLLPLAVDVARGFRLRVAEHVRVSPDDLAPDRRLDVHHVEHAGFGRELSVQDDLQQQIAQLAGQVGSGFLAQGVVDLVRLLEQVLLEGEVGLFAIPRAAVRPAQPIGHPGQRPWAGRGKLGGDGTQVQSARQRRLRELAHRGCLRDSDAADHVIGRVEPGQDGQRRLVRRGMSPR